MPTALRLVRWQVLIAAVGALFWGVAQDFRAAQGAFAGGCIAAALTLFVAWRTLARPPAAPEVIARRFLAAQGMKMVLAAGLFLLAVIAFGKHGFPALITTFIASTFVYRFALLWNR